MQTKLHLGNAFPPSLDNRARGMGFEQIVGIKKHDDVMLGVLQRVATRRQLSLILLKDRLNRVAKGPDDVLGTVRRPVIDDDHLKRRMRLGKRASDHCFDETFVVIGADDDRHPWPRIMSNPSFETYFAGFLLLVDQSRSVKIPNTLKIHSCAISSRWL